MVWRSLSPPLLAPFFFSKESVDQKKKNSFLQGGLKKEEQRVRGFFKRGL